MFPHFQKVTLDRAVSVDWDADGSFARLCDRVEHLSASPEVLALLLRQAVAETILVAVRRRFIQNLPNALEIRRGRGFSPRARGTEEMVRRAAAMDRLSEAAHSGNESRVESARAHLESLNEEFFASLQRSKNGRQIASGGLSSGLFRPLAMQVLQRLTDVTAMAVSVEGASVGVGIGAQAMLNQIKTPSATEHVLQLHPTTSKFNVMWRQLEYGTGLYATDPEGKNHGATRYTQRGGRWVYSKNPPNGMMLEGAKGVHALKQATGVAYDEDALAFPRRFAAAFAAALSGARPI